jgi:hypothetical protein
LSRFKASGLALAATFAVCVLLSPFTALLIYPVYL